MVLIRLHDHKRFWKEPIDDLGSIVVYGDLQRPSWGCYSLNLVNDSSPGSFYFSRLSAKDFIPPFESAGRIGGRRGRTRPNDSPEFIVGEQLSGQPETRQPSAYELGPPVYFDPKVLKRYYDEPSRYSVGFSAPGLGGVAGLNWNFPLGRNEEGFVIAWLGDFIKQGVPLEELRHWKAHNIVPRGGMAEDFWNAQMMCRPSIQPSLERRLLDLRYHLQKVAEVQGRGCFRDYEGPDKHADKALREPLYNEYTEFHEAIRLLSIIFVEYLDVDHFKALLVQNRREDAKGKTLGSIVLFSHWIEDSLAVPTALAARLMSALQRLQAVRSNISGSHRFSDRGYKKALEKLSLPRGASSRDIYRAVAEPLADALEGACDHLGLRDELWWLRKRE
jgi:hypothetical protein